MVYVEGGGGGDATGIDVKHMNVFITGATGVVGRRVVPLMIVVGHRITAAGRTAEKRASLERQGATAISVDLFDPEAVRRAAAGHDVVINLATHIPSSSRAFFPGAWAETDRIRRKAAANLAGAALAGGAARFIQESFAPVYPDCGDRWIDERTPIRPARYNRTVADAEAAAQRFTQGGRVGVVLRFALFYGPDSGYTLDTVKFVRRGWAPTFGSEEGFISSVSHDDAATAVVAALDVPAGIYNVADDEPVRRREYFDSLAAVIGARPPKLPPAWMAKFVGPLGETIARSLRISNRRLRTEGAWAPRHPSVVEGWRALAVSLRRE